MDTVTKQIEELRERISGAVQKLQLTKLIADKDELEQKMSASDFWSDPQAAAAITKQHAALSEKIEPWISMQASAHDISELAYLKDESLKAEIEQQLNVLQSEFETLQKQLRFNGPYDDHAALVSLYAGAGGTDAQDWAAMLLRMYVRWAEKNRLKVITINESTGEEAGIKSTTIEVSGLLAYGKLKGEHGIHRLVRLSPFNADSLRQTSFAKVEVLPKIDEPGDLEIAEVDLKIDVYRAGGHGGQSVNTTDSAVRITHLPTGISVAIQNERSQLQNKETAMTILRSRLVQLRLEQHKEELADIKGPNQSAEWGNQIRSYVLHPYKMVKDLRTNVETSDTEAVLDGDIDLFVNSFEPE